MGDILVKILFISLISVACNDNMTSFTQDAIDPEIKAPLPPIPIDVEGTDLTGGEKPRVIDDEERDELNIQPDDTVAGLSRTFSVNPSHSDEASIDFINATVDNEIEMSAEIVDESREFTQLVRPVYSSRFKQTGTHGDAMTENFAQNEKGILDILLVIDNSISMDKAQENMAQGLPALLNYVANSNWQIAITSTDSRECIRRVITAETVDYEQVFADTIKSLGVEGSSAEETMLMAYRGLRGECQGETSAWLRENSSVAVIVLTDEDYQCYKNLIYTRDKIRPSKFTLCYNKEDSEEKKWNDFYQSIDDFYNYLSEIRVPGESAKIYGIINPVVNYQKQSKWLSRGSKYFLNWRSKDGQRALFDHTANIYADQAGYDTILQNISADISVTLKDQFVLKRQPSAGTMVVKVTSAGETKELHPDEYMVKDKVLTLNAAPPKGASIEVQYAHNAKPDVKNFTLPQLPLPGSVSIEINDEGHIITADPQRYTRNEREITFHTAPPKGATLTISYKENIPLKTELQLGKGRITDLIVTVDGEEIDTYMFDTQSNLITFAPNDLPAEGTLVKAVYNAVLEENLSYQVSKHGSLRDDDNLLCFSVNDPVLSIGCEWQRIANKDYVVFSRGEFVPGRAVIVRQMLDIDNNNLKLQEHYLPQTIQLQVGNKICYASDLVIENNVIVLDEHVAQSACAHLDRDQKITLNYDYIELKQTLSVEASFFNAYPHQYEHWDIKVNGEKVTDFTVTNHTAEFNYQLPPDAVVEVKISLY